MQKFNLNNVEARFIKNILKNTYLPSLPTVTSGDYIVSGVKYCHKDTIIECENTGTLTTEGSIENLTYVGRHKCVESNHKEHKPLLIAPAANEFCICTSDFLCGIGIRAATYHVESNINYNVPTPGLTTNYISKSNTYDIPTHKQLGKYLRYYRDVKNINLMPLYNCFCGEDTENFYINGTLKDGTNGKHVWLVPAQMNKNYTLYINTPHQVSICGVFLNQYGRIKNQNSTNKYLDGLIDNNISVYNSLSYNTPIKYNMFTNNPDVLAYNNHFHIVIQTELNEFPSIVVIEGDHKREYTNLITNSDTYNYKLRKDITNNTEVDVRYNVNFDTFNPPIYSSITRAPLSYHIPYAPKLIEFLSEHVIANEEDIPNNILRIQKALNNNGYNIKEDDIWSSKLRYIIHNNYFKQSNKYFLTKLQVDNNYNPKDINMLPQDKLVYDKKTNKLVGLKNCSLKRNQNDIYDITSYIDKDIENLLFKYRGV